MAKYKTFGDVLLCGEDEEGHDIPDPFGPIDVVPDFWFAGPNRDAIKVVVDVLVLRKTPVVGNGTECKRVFPRERNRQIGLWKQLLQALNLKYCNALCGRGR